MFCFVLHLSTHLWVPLSVYIIMFVFYWCILFVIVHKDFWSIITKEKFCIWLWGKFWVQYYRTINSFLTSLVVFAHFVHCKEVQHYCKSITLLRLSHSQRLSDLKSEVPLTISTLKLIVFLEWHSWALTVLCCDAPGLHSNWRILPDVWNLLFQESQHECPCEVPPLATFCSTWDPTFWILPILRMRLPSQITDSQTNRL